MKIGTRVIVNEKNAKVWGHKIPATGTVIGPDPSSTMKRDDLSNPNVVSVKLDEGPSIYECKGVHVARLTLEERKENDNI